MKRVHLFELDDQTWFPRSLGDAGRAYLRTFSDKLGLHVHLAPLMSKILQETQTTKVIDLGSGAGGPLPSIVSHLRTEGHAVEATLTDLAPSVLPETPDEGISCFRKPVDARSVPSTLVGLRTLFNAFHHFPPDLARAVLKNAVEARQPIAIIELSERRLATVLSSLFIPIMLLVIMPFIRPVRWSWWLFTYLLPILPFTVFWDGLVSHLRTYSVPELEALVAPLTSDEYTWRAERVVVGPGLGVTVLVGRPTSS